MPWKIRKNAWPPNFDNHRALYQMFHQNDLERSKIIFYIYNCLYLTCDISEHIWVKILDLLIVFWSNKVVGVKWNQGIQYWKHYFYIHYPMLNFEPLLSPSQFHNYLNFFIKKKDFVLYFNNLKFLFHKNASYTYQVWLNLVQWI